MIKKILLGLTLTTGLMMANSTDDLLSLATTGKSVGTNLEMNKTDMEKADGGYYSRYRGVGSYYYNANTRAAYATKNSYKSRLSARAFGSYYWGRTYGRK